MVKDFLRRVALFADLEEEQLARLASLVREESHPGNEILFREGDPVDAFFLVAEGGVTVFRDARGKPLQLLARLEEGGYFGEMGLLNRAGRLASARTAGPTRLLRIDKADLLKVLADNPSLELKFRAEIIRRHGMNVSALLGLAGQRDVRIRLGVPAEVVLADGRRQELMLENLSLGGIAFSGVAGGWQTGQRVQFAIAPRGQPPILDITGTLSWSEGDAAGIAFDPLRPGEEALIYKALRRFLDIRT
ncbi:MAG TPA: cyclic nucleotide-binding domain-containing protein [Thermoanaerobaculia bacterium]|nr:cyclic nucleotide-binding domain-containing protein [Thermoanaerobaculia bacterium]